METKEKILDRVRKLLSLSQSTNAHEAAQAAGQAAALMARYQIEEAALASDPEEQDETIGDHHVDGEAGERIDHWPWAILWALCEANTCGSYITNGTRRLYGRIADVRRVAYLYQFFRAETDRLMEAWANAEIVAPGRTGRNSFRKGCASEIGMRITTEYRAERERLTLAASETEEPAARTQALMRIDRSLSVLRTRAQGIKRYGKETLHLRSGGGSSSRIDSHAYQAGRAAGRTVGLGSRAAGAIAGR